SVELSPGIRTLSATAVRWIARRVGEGAVEALGAKPKPKPKRTPVKVSPGCAAGCGYPVETEGSICGECACEDDGI
ncbi:MAG TPA: hypothetical protein VF183_10905, partial [Acidimicrobiales bacterium]